MIQFDEGKIEAHLEKWFAAKWKRPRKGSASRTTKEKSGG